jgi:hypothetical protein
MLGEKPLRGHNPCPCQNLQTFDHSTPISQSPLVLGFNLIPRQSTSRARDRMTFTIHVEGLLGSVKTPDQDPEAQGLRVLEDRLELIVKNGLSSKISGLLEHFLVVLNHAGEMSVFHADDFNVALGNIG